MTNELGKMIGKVVHSCSTKGDLGWKRTTSITIDFSLVPDSEITSWLCSNRVIAGQRAWRSMAEDEFMNNVHESTIPALEIGKKVKTRQERIDALTAIGLPDDLAAMAVDNPTGFKASMDSVAEMDELEGYNE